jgi:insertion element IS1 protein InsB
VGPRWKSAKDKNNGHLHNGTQNHHGHDCGRPCVQCCELYRIAADQRSLRERVLVERMSLRGLGRAVGGTRTWLLGWLVPCSEALPEQLHVQPLTGHGTVRRRRLAVEADALARLGQKPADTQGLWSALDATTRHVMAWQVGERRRKRAKRLWATMPEAYRQPATLYTAPYVGAAGGMPAAPHRALRQWARQTPPIARVTTTLRQRVSRLVRETWSFSKKLANQSGAIKRFIGHDNLTRAVA